MSKFQYYSSTFHVIIFLFQTPLQHVNDLILHLDCFLRASSLPSFDSMWSASALLSLRGEEEEEDLGPVSARLYRSWHRTSCSNLRSCGGWKEEAVAVIGVNGSSGLACSDKGVPFRQRRMAPIGRINWMALLRKGEAALQMGYLFLLLAGRRRSTAIHTCSSLDFSHTRKLECLQNKHQLCYIWFRTKPDKIFQSQFFCNPRRHVRHSETEYWTTTEMTVIDLSPHEIEHSWRHIGFLGK